MTPALALLGAAAGLVLCAVVVLAVRGVLMRRRLRTLTAHLRRHAATGAHHGIPVTLGDRDVDGLAARVNGLLRDLAAARARTERGEEEFRSLIADVSHDLRTPLTAVRGYQQLLADGPLRPEDRARLDIARRHADDLAALVDRLYEYTYLVGARTAPDPRDVREVDLVRLVTDVLLGQVDPLQAADVEPRLTGAASAPMTVDAAALTRIVSNLVRNAWQHGEGWLQVDVSVDEPGDRVVVRVANGIPAGVPIDPVRIFDRFTTGDPARSGARAARTGEGADTGGAGGGSSARQGGRRGGSGLGLAIVAALTARLGGTVRARVEEHHPPGRPAPPPEGAAPERDRARVPAADHRGLVIELSLPRRAPTPDGTP